WDLPTGGAMVCAFGAALVLAGLLRPLVGGNRERVRQTVRAARAGVAALLVLSGVWLTVAPCADQPLLDTVEYALPDMRGLYLNAGELEVIRDAARTAERYRREAERLNEREARSRWQGEALTDLEVRRISSFLQSYNEMRKGEEFVK